MKVVLTILLVLFIFTNSFAYDIDKKRHLWDMQHVSLSCIATAYINHTFKMPFWKSALTTLAFGIVWESLDELHQHGMFSQRFDKIFDKRYGFDHRDLLRNGIGVMISFPIRKK